MALSTCLFDLSDWTQIAIRGEDRKSFLHSFCTNDINRMEVGDVCEAFIPDIKGRILGHVLVIVESEQLRLVACPGVDSVLVPHLTKYLLGVEAEVVDITESDAMIALAGPNSLTAFGAKTELPHDHSQTMTTDQGEATIVCIPFGTTSLYLVTGKNEVVSGIKNQWIESEEIHRGDASEFERLRIEAGFPIVGRDVSDANIAQEAARTERAISFEKGCYLGQEPIARLDAMGHTNKELRGLHIQAADVRAGNQIFIEEKEVGNLSSVAVRDDGTCVGLAILRAKYCSPGTTVTVTTDSGTFPAKVYWPTLES